MILLSPLDRFGLMAGGRALPATDVLIDANQDRLDLAAYLIANDHWDGESAATITVTIAPGVNITSPNGSPQTTPALLIDDSFSTAEVNLTVINLGSIRGGGGNGGIGAGTLAPGNSGFAGGDAVKAESAVSIDNGSGTIAGGGGGGGGGGAGTVADGESCNTQGGGNGGPGAGVGGAGGGTAGQAPTGGSGGSGGALGTSGSSGVAGTNQCGGSSGGGPGGSAGNYINGNSNVTWLANGTRLGGAV